MSKENLEQFINHVSDNEARQEKIGEEIGGEALIALGLPSSIKPWQAADSPATAIKTYGSRDSGASSSSRNRPRNRAHGAPSTSR